MGNICRSSNTTKTQLSQKQLDQLEELTDIPQQEILIYYREFLQASPTGRMTYVQFENQLKTMGVSTDGSKAIFEMIDKDNSGQISFEEYLFSMLTFSHQSQPEQQLAAVFDTYQALSRSTTKSSANDLHRQGMKREDIEHMLQRIHPDLSKDYRQKLVDRYMTNDQNKNGYLSKQEFIVACMKNSKLMEQLGHKDAAIKEDKHVHEN